MTDQAELSKRQAVAEAAYDRMMKAIMDDERFGQLSLNAAKSLADACRRIAFDAMTEIDGSHARMRNPGL